MRRLLAFVLAAAMVAGALAYRNRRDHNDQGPASTLRLVCATELADACQGMKGVTVTVEAAGDTAARLARGDRAGLDAWLVPQPWPAIADDMRQRAGHDRVLSAGGVLARSPLVIAMFRSRATVLRSFCRGDPGWRCLGEAAAKPGGWADVGGPPAWGPVKPAYGDPHTSAVGLLVVGQATAAYLGKPELSTNDLEASDTFGSWLGSLQDAVRLSGGFRSESPVDDQLTSGGSAFDAVGTTEADAAPRVAGASRQDVVLLYPSPVATADVVLARIGGRRANPSLDDGLRRGLARTGWRVTGQPRARGVPATPALPPTDGLPPAGLLESLQTGYLR